jgi:hypothetical protein
MNFNMGTPKFSRENWPKFYDAYERNDPSGMAHESRRGKTEEDRRKLKTRNDKTHDLFMQNH